MLAQVQTCRAPSRGQSRKPVRPHREGQRPSAWRAFFVACGPGRPGGPLRGEALPARRRDKKQPDLMESRKKSKSPYGPRTASIFPFGASQPAHHEARVRPYSAPLRPGTAMKRPCRRTRLASLPAASVARQSRHAPLPAQPLKTNTPNPAAACSLATSSSRAVFLPSRAKSLIRTARCQRAAART